MTTSRLSRIVEEINGLHPDVIVLAGDFVTHDAFSTTSYTVARSGRAAALASRKIPCAGSAGQSRSRRS